MDPNDSNFKFLARQATSIHAYKNLKVKLTNCNANVYFNRQCLIRKIVPLYAKKIKIPHTSPAAITTQGKAQLQRIKDEIRYLYKKKQHLNTELYHAHLKAAQEWNGTWDLISNHIHTIVNRQATTKYKTIHKKLEGQLPNIFILGKELC
jgi:hypothetical protein